MKVNDTGQAAGSSFVDAHHRRKERDFWLTTLSGDLIKTVIPADSRKEKNYRQASEAFVFHTQSDVYTKLMHLANRSDLRLYIILLTGVVLLLEKYTGSDDILVGSPIYRQDIEGDFINKILVLRNRVTAKMTFKELLLQVSRSNMEAVEHVNYPLETIAFELDFQPTANDNDFPLFDVAVCLENIHERSYLDHLDLGLVFTFSTKENGITGVVDYNAELYKKETISRIISYYVQLMHQALNNIDAGIHTISGLSAEETRQLIVDFNAPRGDFPRDKTLHDLFREQAQRTPGSLALRCHTGHLTYGVLQQAASRWAHLLNRHGAGVETIAAVMLEHSLELVTAILGILQAGAAYLPIDPSYPVSRINYFLADSHTRYLIARRGAAEECTFDGIIFDPSHSFANEPPLPDGKTVQDTNSLGIMQPLAGPAHLAYVIYTSGTTGNPKGVLISHSSAVNYVCWAARTYLQGRILNFPLYSSISFDLTVTSLFTPLITGGTVIIYRNPEQGLLIEEIMRDNKTGVIKLTPSHLYMLKYQDTSASQVTCFILGGEALEDRIAREIYGKFRGQAEIYNEYGPTEATVGCLIYRFDPGLHDGEAVRSAGSSGSVPVGVPIAQTQVYILDRQRSPVPIGVTGEIYVAGAGLARGYLNSPGTTADKFVANPFSKGQRMYRTGDLARMLPSGHIDFLGRVDQQVKIRGYRIETGEIEQCLAQHRGILEAVVMARDAKEKSSGEEKQDQYLCAYFVALQDIRVSDLRDYLAGHLPAYMIPQYFVQLEKIPLTANGKLDRKALPIPGLIKEREYIAPRDEVEKKLVDIWAEVLRIEAGSVGIDDSFFDLGGQSLKQVFLLSKIHKELDVDIPSSEIFKRQTIRELSEYVRGAEKDKYISIQPVEKKEFYPTSSAQKRIFFIHQMEFEKKLYNVVEIIRLNIKLDIPLLQRTFQRLIERHESFRTSFFMVQDAAVQKVYDQVDFALECFESGATDPTSANQDDAIREIIDGFIRPFDLAQAPLLRVGLITLGENKYILMLDYHHIIGDWVSTEIMVREFKALYDGQLLPPLHIQYKDFSEWQNSSIIKQKAKKQEQYWLDRFADDIPVMEIPTDFPRPRLQRFEGDVFQFTIDKQTTRAIDNFVRQYEATFFIFIIAAFNVLMAKLSRREDILIGTVLAGRKHADLEKIFGIFINTLVLRNFPKSGMTFINFLDDVKTSTLDAFENQEFQFEDLLRLLDVPRDLSRSPMFDVMLNWMELIRDAGPSAVGESRGTMQGYQYSRKISKFDMLWYGMLRSESIHFSLEYNTGLFKRETIERIAGYFKMIVSAAVEHPQLKLEQIDIMAPAEKQEILDTFNRTQLEYEAHKSIAQLFTEQARKSPDRPALCGFSGTGKGQRRLTLSYRQLAEKAGQLSCFLSERGVAPGDIIAVMTPRTVEMMIAMMAVLQTGAAYIPLDPAYPADRSRFILADSKTRIILTQEAAADAFQDICPAVDLDQVIYHQVSSPAGSPRLAVSGTASAPAYVIYTSGSTGRPKGVMIENRSIVNFIEGITAVVPYGVRDCLYSLTTFSFDIFVLESLLPLTRGTKVVIGNRVEQLDVTRAAAIIWKEKVNLLQLTPSALQVYVANRVSAPCLKLLEVLFVGGEAFPRSLLEKVQPLVKGRIINMYGPTETTVWSTLRDVTAVSSVDIGKPIANTAVYILDNEGNAVPIGVPGELCIAGDGLARGYLNNPEMTAEKFITYTGYKKCAKHSHSPAQKQTNQPITLYKTGDLARWLADGNIEYLGRIDFQVKIMGFRIEVGEIENRLASHPDIDSAAVVVKSTGSNRYLCAYLVLTEAGAKPTMATLRKYLMEKLPYYMVPSHFIQLDKFPLTPNLKIDRKRLATMEGTRLDSGGGEVAPKSEQEKKIADIWKVVLKLKDVGVQDNFFEVGGSSLNIIQVTDRLKQAFNRDIPITTIFEHSTIRALAQYFSTTQAGQAGDDHAEDGASSQVDRSGEIDEGKARLLERRRLRQKTTNQE